MGILDKFRRAATLIPAPARLLQSFDAAAMRADRLATKGLDTLVTLAEAGAHATRAVWQPTPPSTSLTQIVPINTSTWTVPEVRNALDLHEHGMFVDSSTLVDAMGRDDRITGCLNTRVRALAGKSGIGFSVEPSKHGDAEFREDIARELSELWPHVFPESVQSRVMRDSVMQGFAVCRVHWELINGRRIPRLEPWDLRGVFWDWSVRRYRAIAMEGVFTIDPFNGEWFVFEPGGYRSWMCGLVRVLGIMWCLRTMTYRDWARYSEKHGFPIVAVKEPSGTQWERHKGSFWQRMRQMGVEATLRLPTDEKGYGFDVELIEATARSENAFRLLLDKIEVNIAIALLGQNLSTEVQGGSFAAATAHNAVRLDYLDADAQTISTAIRESLLKAFVRFNYPGVDENTAPFPTWQTKPPDDEKAAAAIFAQVIGAIGAARGQGVQLPAAWVKDTWDIPVKYVDPPAEGGPGAPEGGPGGPAPSDIPAGDDAPAPKPAPAADDDAADPDGEDDAPPAKQAKKLRDNIAKKQADLDKVTRTLEGEDAGEQATALAASVDADELDEVYAAWSSAVNMTAGELEAWSKTEASRLASVRPHAVIARNLRLLRTPKSKWDARDIRDAWRTVNFIQRMRAMPNGDPVRKGFPSKRDISLKNWAFDPDKPSAHSIGEVALSGAPLTRTIAGVAVRIDRPRGTVQTGIAPDGSTWTRTYQVDYGEVPDTAGGDGDPIDVFCGDVEQPTTVWWILQRDASGEFDELKLMLGFASMGDAVACYLAHVPARFMGQVVPMPVGVLRGMLGLDPVQQATALTALSTGKQYWKARRRSVKPKTAESTGLPGQVALPLAGVAALDWDESAHPRDADGKFGSGGGGESSGAKEAGGKSSGDRDAHGDKPKGDEHERREDGKPLWKEPPAPGAADHPFLRDEQPVHDPATFVAGTRTDPAMWDGDKEMGFTYMGDDPPADHEWPKPSGSSDDLQVKTDPPGGTFGQAAAHAARDTAAAHPVAHWVMQQHPLDKVTCRPLPPGMSLNVGGYYVAGSNAIALNPATLDRTAGKPYAFGSSHSVSADLGGRAHAASALLHELGHHIETYPGVGKIVREAWEERDRANQHAAASEYARTNEHEYFAESWALYNRDRATLRDNDHTGYMMVERALAKIERGSNRRGR